MFVRSARPHENFGRVIVIFACVLLLAGCPAPPKAPPRVTPLSSSSGSMIPRPVDQPALSSVHLPGDPSFAFPQDRPDSVLPEEALQIPTGLIALNEWAQICGFTDLRVVPDANPYTVELEGPNGILSLTFGHRFAKWNGMNLGISFGPSVKQGQLVVHSIDVHKNFYPLALGTFSIPKPTRILILDPGHGGSDPGSLAAGRTYEKELTLDWALRIEKLLEGSRWKVLLTRRDDRDVSLMDRVAFADRQNGDIFVSLHFNSLEKSSGTDESGIETFCTTPVGAPSSVTRGYEDDVRRYFPNNQFDAENILLATRLHHSLVKSSGRRDRGVRRARFMTVLREQRRPAVLVEGGFLSSAAEGKLILDADYRQQIAVAICNALPN